MRARLFVTLLAALLAAVLCAACVPWETREPAVKPLPTVPPDVLSSGNAARGRELFTNKGCAACHSIGGVGGSAGPALDAIANRAQRPTLAGNLENTPENLWRWITNPQAVKRGTPMASQPLSPQEAADLVAYLETLQ